jgi:hypothetical protein
MIQKFLMIAIGTIGIAVFTISLTKLIPYYQKKKKIIIIYLRYLKQKLLRFR